MAARELSNNGITALQNHIEANKLDTYDGLRVYINAVSLLAFELPLEARALVEAIVRDGKTLFERNNELRFYGIHCIDANWNAAHDLMMAYRANERKAQLEKENR